MTSILTTLLTVLLIPTSVNAAETSPDVNYFRAPLKTQLLFREHAQIS
jgi:hypothetical protein